MPIYSHSKILSFETCPLRYKYAYIERVEPDAEQSAEIYLGERVHEALEKLYRNLDLDYEMSKNELMAFYNREWEKKWTDSVLILKEDMTQEDYRKQGEKYIRDYYKTYKPFKEGRIVGLELTDSLTLDDKGTFRYYIRIDRLMDIGDGLYEIHDYKTNLTLPNQKELDEDRQLAMYSLWVRKEFKDCRDVRLVWHFLAFNKEMESYRTEEELENLRHMVLNKIRTIEEAKEYPAETSRLCFWCLYKSRCPYWVRTKPADQEF